MFDGPILSTYPGTPILIYMNPQDFDKNTGHFNNQYCWCLPQAIKYTWPDGNITDEIGHKAINYRFMEDQLNGQVQK